MTEPMKENARKLDELIATRVMGWRWTTDECEAPELNHGRCVRPDGIVVHDFCPSSGIAAAFSVVEAMFAKGWQCDMRVTFDGYAVDFDDLARTVSARVDPREGGMPLAICRAALAASTPAEAPLSGSHSQENQPHE